MTSLLDKRVIIYKFLGFREEVDIRAYQCAKMQLKWDV
jgi:hypothetical protein